MSTHNPRLNPNTSHEVYSAPEAPRDLLSLSPFLSDERCTTFEIVVSEDQDRVAIITHERWLELTNTEQAVPAGTSVRLLDYDTGVQDSVSGLYVGFIVRDLEPTLVIGGEDETTDEVAE